MLSPKAATDRDRPGGAVTDTHLLCPGRRRHCALAGNYFAPERRVLQCARENCDDEELAILPYERR
jgi:hypothetical protein